ncbi:hypothetical protein [Bacillus taeanensis]|uniref:hypothetical protein n=1 Tax=Bacillus taeanensis TaxID=273032 RepID=UPI0015F11345|nr:hypothetical protein [Bacillus taeanensis]
MDERYAPADLKGDVLQKIKHLEQEINEQTNGNIVLIAYDKNHYHDESDTMFRKYY